VHQFRIAEVSMAGLYFPDRVDLPSAADLEPLVRLAATYTLAADDAATLLALLETGRWITTAQRTRG
jgi:hypothetical protein